MRVTIAVCALALALLGCEAKRGPGFDHYPIPAKKNAGQPIEIKWKVLEPVPRHRVSSVPKAKDARSVYQYEDVPKASVSAKTAPDVWLRVVESADNAWLVAHSTTDIRPAPHRLRSEVVQRSGCLVTGSYLFEQATVFELDCS